MSWTLDQMAQQVAMALRDGEFVDVGGGLADDVLRHVPAGTERRVHLGEARTGMTQYPTDDYMDAGFIVTGQDASQARRTIMFHSSESFAAMSITTADVAIRDGSRRDPGTDCRFHRAAIRPRTARGVSDKGPQGWK